jgi:hypothetical protein
MSITELTTACRDQYKLELVLTYPDKRCRSERLKGRVKFPDGALQFAVEAAERMWNEERNEVLMRHANTPEKPNTDLHAVA